LLVEEKPFQILQAQAAEQLGPAGFENTPKVAKVISNPSIKKIIPAIGIPPASRDTDSFQSWDPVLFL
jgi:hypothetical protein